MKYRVSGTNRDTGARMILEFDASNRAMAERKATQSGMGEVLHTEVIQEATAAAERKTRRGEFEPTRRARTLMLVFLIALALLAFFFWPRIRALL